MKQYQVLNICARIEGHPLQRRRLKKYCQGFENWQALVESAEREGMAPLLRKHLLEAEVALPPSIRRSLNLLYRRHQKQAEVRLSVLETFLKLFEKEKLTPILLKGAALCSTLYPDPALRPMRDMDILFHKKEVDKAHGLLLDTGFQQSNLPIPSDHFHLPSLHQTIDGVKICFELHHGLYPNCPPWYPQIDFEYYHQTGKTIEIGGVAATVFNDEQMLHYLYQHGFRTPLTYEQFKLINAADLIGFMERHFHTLDWGYLSEHFPILRGSLPMLNSLSPFNPVEVPADCFEKHYQLKMLKPTPYKGWPKKRRKQWKAEGGKIISILRETFIPSRWWVGIYYGKSSLFRYLFCLIWEHPKHIFWWFKLQITIDKSERQV